MPRKPGKADYDPYAIPESNVEDPWHGSPHGGWGNSKSLALADIGSRLGARMVDWLTQFLVLLPGFGVMVFGVSQSPNGQINEAWLLGAIATFCLFLLLLFCVNLYYLYENGQTIGKKVLGIKIVSEDGSPAFGKIVLLRMFVMGLLESLPFGIGLIVAIVNVCMIFGQDRRCLHDVLAGTIVVTD